MFGDDALKLVREARRASAAAVAAAAANAVTGVSVGAAVTAAGASNNAAAAASAVGLAAYNEETVRNVLRELRRLFEDTRAVLQEGDNGDIRVVIYHAAMQRNKRCLLAYHMQRVESIVNICWELGTLPPPNVRALLSKPEVDFMRGYNSLVTQYKSKYIDLDLMATLLPPKELHVEVRVIQDCGVIQTEQGSIHLRRNSQHFVRRTDVEHLVKQGLLIHLD